MFDQEPAQGVLHAGVIRGEFVGLFGRAQCPAVIFALIEVGQIVEGNGIVRVRFQQCLILRDGLAAAVGLHVVLGCIAACYQILRVPLDPVGELLVRCPGIARRKNGTVQFDEPGCAGAFRQGLLVGLDGLRDTLLDQQDVGLAVEALRRFGLRGLNLAGDLQRGLGLVFGQFLAEQGVLGSEVVGLELDRLSWAVAGRRQLLVAHLGLGQAQVDFGRLWGFKDQAVERGDSERVVTRQQVSPTEQADGLQVFGVGIGH